MDRIQCRGASKLLLTLIVVLGVTGCSDKNPMPEGFKKVRLGMTLPELKAAVGADLLRPDPKNEGVYEMKPAGAFKEASFRFFGKPELESVTFVVKEENDDSLFRDLCAQAEKKFGGGGDSLESQPRFFDFERKVRWVSCSDKFVYDVKHFKWEAAAGGTGGLEVDIRRADSSDLSKKKCAKGTEAPAL